MTRKMKRVIAAIALIAVVATGFCGCKKKQGQSPYMTAINNLAEAYNGNRDAVKKAAPEDAWKYLEKNKFDREDHADRIGNKQELFLKDLQELYGKEAYVSISVSDASKCGEEQLKKIAKALNNTYGIRIASVQEAYQMKRTIKVVGNTTVEYESTEIYTVKIDNQWYVLYDQSRGENPAFYFPFLSSRDISLST